MIFHRGETYWTAAASWVASLMLATVAHAATVNLVEDGRANAVIVIPSDAGDTAPLEKHPLFIEFGLMHSDARTAAELLARYVRESTGAALPIVTDDQLVPETNAIHVGPTGLAQSRLSDVEALDDDGFLIAVPDASNVILLGKTPIGAEFAVCDFLERELGVRWLFEGDLGEHVPVRQNLSVAGPDRVSQPTFKSRFFYIRGADGYIQGMTPWARRNRVHSRIEFHHNISKLVPVSWTKSHPAFFPLIDGERRLPKRMNQDDWHLCYAADGVAHEVAELIRRNLEKYPQYGSISLGVSDGGEDAYCHCIDCLAVRRGVGLNSLDYDHYSDQYYQWCNDVLNRVTVSHPEKLFGCLAYREVVDPPSFAVHDNLVPYLTYELLQWAVPERREAWKRQVRAWSSKAKHFGHYEYMFGEKHMLVPRIYLHALADYCRFAADQGAIGFYAETTGMNVRTMWYAGPQPYILLRLLWNPDADVDALLADWCAAAVGSNAAPYLEQYFRYWEHVWTQRVPQTDWFGKTSQLYLKFNSDEYLAAMRPEDLSICDAYLAAAVEHADAGKPRQRAEMFLAEFRKRRAERLDYQIDVWDAQRYVDIRAADAPVFQYAFTDGMKGWAPVSSNDTAKPVHDPALGAVRLTDNSTLGGPTIELAPDSAYVVSWNVKAVDVPPGARVTFIMQVGGDASYAVHRNLTSNALPGDWQSLRYAFRTQPGEKAAMFSTVLYVRGMKQGALLLKSISIAPFDAD